MAGWAGSDPAEGRTPEAECQWWADRLGIRQAEGGLAGASRLFYSPEAESSGERFRPWGAARLLRSSRRRRIPALLPKEDCRVLASSRTTMRQGVDQPCWIRGSGGCGPALPSPSPPAHGTTGLGGVGGDLEDGGGHWRGGWSAPYPPRRRRRAGMGLLQPCACSRRGRRAAGAAAPAVGVWEGWQVGRERKVASQSGRKGEV